MPLINSALRNLIGITALLQWKPSPADGDDVLCQRFPFLTDSIVALQFTTGTAVTHNFIQGEEIVRQNEGLFEPRACLEVFALSRGLERRSNWRGRDRAVVALVLVRAIVELQPCETQLQLLLDVVAVTVILIVLTVARDVFIYRVVRDGSAVFDVDVRCIINLNVCTFFVQVTEI